MDLLEIASLDALHCTARSKPDPKEQKMLQSMSQTASPLRRRASINESE